MHPPTIVIRAALCGFILICCFSGAADACRVSTTSILRVLPADADAPVILKVTVKEASKHLMSRGFSIAVAHVDQVIKGGVTSDTVTIRTHVSTCGGALRAGDVGFVLGEFEADSTGIAELRARSFNALRYE